MKRAMYLFNSLTWWVHWCVRMVLVGATASLEAVVRLRDIVAGQLGGRWRLAAGLET